MYRQISHNIEVTVTPEYEDEQSSPMDNFFIWEYNIRIKNNSSDIVQLLRRHWVLVDDKGQMQEIDGDGVIGLQPVLKQGEEFEYSSSVHLTESSGVMMGSYDMVKMDGEVIIVEIPPFSLDCPHIQRIAN
ncbi:MAG: Co2+/Mg2+ efflux protein ApaG [Rickettsiales bacterium]|nr:Co2+/Mg2+ efflux protein ApaG [Pseudomonadota bacterium]MDA0965382.1 Co2+/Mg2+ efflux protein ApaG [Pseudomonadota bacterium]MDG4544310.1 Co2+/Mg2+ efflux protein ApaG [Rickettsiales bacterium]MDG4544845.1 Co2+/Mg2+ efflux protein ApaG [Rickettsiales bacterium]MDG4546967.1 Co2+/Mg2+ efflux protein ApaG [Rickettsiales bacterium]